jgi:hypothetical protein
MQLDCPEKAICILVYTTEGVGSMAEASPMVGDIVWYGVMEYPPGYVHGPNSPPPVTPKAAIIVEILPPEEGEGAVKLVVFGMKDSASGEFARYSPVLADGMWTHRPDPVSA